MGQALSSAPNYTQMREPFRQMFQKKAFNFSTSHLEYESEKMVPNNSKDCEQTNCSNVTARDLRKQFGRLPDPEKSCRQTCAVRNRFFIGDP